ncbi:ATP-grasp domain-containing protein [Streptomyces sp. NPDC053048]|uniref:ATP-grasp domain-containing protein n=1 Tax=Streptomyces sp. NPDC053048 TaxID=3365694 RepID=UPI0037D48CDD
MAPLIVFCADPLDPRRADPHFREEARAARALGLPTALLDHDALLAGDAAGAVARVPRGAGAAWYRGWMVPSERYAGLAEALAARGGSLLTSPDDYRRAHELPGWYGTFASLTPRSVWLPAAPGRAPDAAALAERTAVLGGGPAVVKDYVKSRKHEWHEACYVPELADRDRLASVVARFVELQEDFLAGGVVVRAFERFTEAGEARVWWVDGRPVLVTAHPDHPELRPEPELSAVAPAVGALGCRFVTTDLARHEDGRWRVVEVGDGQVSDLPRGAGAEALLEALAGAGGGQQPQSPPSTGAVSGSGGS